QRGDRRHVRPHARADPLQRLGAEDLADAAAHVAVELLDVGALELDDVDVDHGDVVAELAHALARESVSEFRDYVAMIYVDVIEFEGTHIQKFYGDMGRRIGEVLGPEALERIRSRMRPNVPPISALLLTARIFFNYFSIEILFNVAEPFGKDSATVVREIADILRNGMLV